MRDEEIIEGGLRSDKPYGLGAARMLFVSSLLILFFAGSASAMYPVTDVYCKRMGYNLTTAQGPYGMTWYCIMPGGEMCLPSDFLAGTCGAEYSYCVLKGHGLKLTGAESKCVLEDGSEEWVSKLVKADVKMGGLFKEEKMVSPCGDGVCFHQDESFKTCPEDCFFQSTTPEPSTAPPSTQPMESTPEEPPVMKPPTTVRRPPVKPVTPPAKSEGIPFHLIFVGVTLVLGAGYYFVLKGGKTGSE